MPRKSPFKDLFKSKDKSTTLPTLEIPSSIKSENSPGVSSRATEPSPRCPISSCRRFLSKNNESKCRCVYETYYKNLPNALQEMVSNAGKEKSFVYILEKPVVMNALRANKGSDINEGDDIEILKVFHNFTCEGKVLRTGVVRKFDLSVFMPHDHSSRGEDELHKDILDIIISMKSVGISNQMLAFPLLVKAAYDYSANETDEMSVKQGDYIILEYIYDDLWGQGFKLSQEDGQLLVQSRSLLHIPLSIITDPINVKYETYFIRTLPKSVQSALYSSHISVPLGFAGLLKYNDEAIIEKSKLPNDVHMQELSGNAEFIYVNVQGVFNNGFALINYDTKSNNRVFNVKLADLHFFNAY